MAILTDILNRYLGANGGNVAGELADDFHHVTRNVSPDVLSKGLSAALGSEQTPPAGEMVAQMFEASTPEQRAAMLNQLLAALGPAGVSMLRDRLGQAATPATASSPITPGQAANVSPQQVQDVVTQAQQHNPGIIDSLSDFYAQHPGLVKTLGGAALAIALGKISRHVQGLA
jgi:uncharacterized protein YidB (DUF937 family)